VVFFAHESGGMTVAFVPTDKHGMSTLVAKFIAKGSVVNTDELSAYKSLNDLGYVHRVVNHSQKEYARDDVHTNNCEGRTTLCRMWLAKYMGVNKYNLCEYLNVYLFMHNLRESGAETKMK